ncbi:hypothetical protein [Campylobacter magnus]|uniref:hypothetical protein n=1 Tax=Campylobacter magnus TaxID=3026462 RepID=UPI0026DF9E03|nr:hypothetical protein [Campylobacter magnus]MDO2407934.1 hypothetical protein [Campylobacter magnus]
MINLLYKIFRNSRIPNLEFPKNCFLSAGSVRGFFFEILFWTAQHLTSELLHRFPAQAAFIFTR